jgi:hypothetical protein
LLGLCFFSGTVMVLGRLCSLAALVIRARKEQKAVVQV